MRYVSDPKATHSQDIPKLHAIHPTKEQGNLWTALICELRAKVYLTRVAANEISGYFYYKVRRYRVSWVVPNCQILKSPNVISQMPQAGPLHLPLWILGVQDFVSAAFYELQGHT